jgi:hypothetical protein
MKWVKASDVMPEETQWPELHYRVDGAKVDGTLMSNYDAAITWFEYKKASRYIQLEDLSRVEWLCEDESPTEQEGKEYARPFQQRVEELEQGLRELKKKMPLGWIEGVEIANQLLNKK